MKIINWLYHHPYKFALAVFVAFLVFYASSIPVFNVGYADSDEFLAVAKNWGIAHPPGYSLYISVLHLFMNFPMPLTTPAFRAHFLSALSTASALALSVLVFKLIFRRLYTVKFRSESLYVFSVLISLFATATSKQLWLYSQITEKYLFAAPFLILLLYFGLILVFKTSKRLLHYSLFGFLFGLLISHHQSLLFLFPYVIVTLFFALKQSTTRILSGLTSFMGVIAGIILSFGLLFIQINRQETVPFTWRTSPGLTGIIEMVTRADFRGELYAQNITTNGYIPKDLRLSRLLNGGLIYLQNFGQSYNWWIFIPLTFSIYFLFKSKKVSATWLIILPPLLIGPLLLAYLSWPQDIGSQAITERFFLTSYFAALPLIFIGITEILRRLNLVAEVLHLPPKPSLALKGIFPLYLIVQTIILYPQISLKSFDLVSTLYRNVLSEVKPNSLISCYSDTSCFALIYEQSVNQMRPDVDVVPLAFPLVSKNLETKKLAQFTYKNNPFLMFDIVTHNLDKRPIYALDLNRYYFSFFGVPNAFMYALPDGYKTELTRTMPQTLPDYDYELSRRYLAKTTPKFDKYRLFLMESLTQNHASNSYVYLKRGDRTRAQQELNLAVNLSYRLTSSQTKNVEATRNNLESIQIDPRFSPGSTVIDPQKLLETLPEYYKRQQYAKALSTVLGSLTINPNHIEARLELARIYKNLGDIPFSKLEYTHVLMLDPTNEEALAETNEI